LDERAKAVVKVGNDASMQEDELLRRLVLANESK
jgi:hypothetical protein